jgi:hypothetical protein
MGLSILVIVMLTSSVNVLPCHYPNTRKPKQKLLLAYTELEERRVDHLERNFVQSREKSKNTSLG